MAIYNKNGVRTFGDAVQERLSEVEMTQRELARLTGINEGYLSRILGGFRPGFKYREKIRRVLGMSSPREMLRRID
jgi:transcriptional regulator with XRE-family HTH domain